MLTRLHQRSCRRRNRARSTRANPQWWKKLISFQLHLRTTILVSRSIRRPEPNSLHFSKIFHRNDCGAVGSPACRHVCLTQASKAPPHLADEIRTLRQILPRRVTHRTIRSSRSSSQRKSLMIQVWPLLIRFLLNHVILSAFMNSSRFDINSDPLSVHDEYVCCASIEKSLEGLISWQSLGAASILEALKTPERPRSLSILSLF